MLFDYKLIGAPKRFQTSRGGLSKSYSQRYRLLKDPPRQVRTVSLQTGDAVTVAIATINPARAIDKLPKLGTLQVGAPGDVTMLEVVEGPVEFVDTRNNKRQGKAVLRPVQTVNGGIVYGRPYSAPFSVH